MSTRIPEVQKLKDRIIALPEAECEQLRVWLDAIVSVRRELSRPAKTPKTQKPKNAKETNGNENGQS